MITRQIGLVSDLQGTPIAMGDLMKVAAALQKQATEDLGPVWDVTATVDPFATLEDVPVGYWPLMIVDHVPNAAGIHLDRNGQPYALATFGPDWSLTASHECLEMLVDPYGNKLKTGLSPQDQQTPVEFLVEVCDPSEASQFAYTKNGITVSDFYLPAYFDDSNVAGARYSHTGAITKPRDVLEGGYLSWHEPQSNHWRQKRWLGSDAPQVVDLGEFTASGQVRSVRSWIYTKTAAAVVAAAATARAQRPAAPAAALGAGPTGGSPSSSRAKRLREELVAWKS